MHSFASYSILFPQHYYEMGNIFQYPHITVREHSNKNIYLFIFRFYRLATEELPLIQL